MKDANSGRAAAWRGFVRRHRHAEEAVAEAFGLNLLWTGLRLLGVFGAGLAAAAVVTTSAPSYHPNYTLSIKGAAFITRAEGVRYTPYNDPWNCTVGVGHLVHYGPCSLTDYSRWRLTPTQTTTLLIHDAETAGSYVRQSVTFPINQAQYDALVSFTFNVGGGALQRSSALSYVNAGRFSAVPDALGLWSYASGVYLSGLHTRRSAEGHLFVTGDYGPGIGRYVPKPAPVPRRTRAQLRAPLRKRILAARKHGSSWAAIKRTVVYHRYIALGGH